MPKTDFYYRFFNDIGNRFDENYNHPRYDEINFLINKRMFSKVMLLGDAQVLREIVSGKTPPGVRYQAEGVPFLGASNVVDGGVDIENCPKIDEKVHNGPLNASKIMKGDLLITMAGTIGRCAIYNHEEEANCNQAVAVLRFQENVLLPEYAAYYLNSEIGHLFFEKLQHISSQPNINLTEIQIINIILPDKPQQVAILKELNEIRKDLLAIKKNQHDKINEIQNSMLNELDFKTKAPKTYFFNKGKESSVSYYAFLETNDRLHFLFKHPKLKLIQELIKKYSTVALIDICKKPLRRGEQPIYVAEGEVRVIKTIDMKNFYIDLDNCLRVSREFFNLNKNTQISKGDILIASTGYGSLGKVDIYESQEPAMVDGHISILRLKEGYDPYFVAYFLRSPLGQIQFEKWFSGSSGQIEIQPSDIESFLLPSSLSDGIPLERQKKLAQKISEKLKEIQALIRKEQEVRVKINRKLKELLFKNK